MNAKPQKTALGTFLFRTLGCALFFLAFCLLCSGICFATKNPTGYLKLFSLSAFLLSGALSGFVYGKKERNLQSFLPLVCFSLILLTLALILREGDLILTVPVNLCCYLTVGGLCFLLGGSGGKKKKRKKPYGER